MLGAEKQNLNCLAVMIRKPKFMNMENVEMTQEELNASIEIGEVIETDKGEKLRCIGKENGVPQWEMI